MTEQQHPTTQQPELLIQQDKSMPDYEQIQQENTMWPWLVTGSMADSYVMDQQRNSDYLDAMADIAAEMEEAMRESSQDEWDGVEEISFAERNACDHYNERYVIND